MVETVCGSLVDSFGVGWMHARVPQGNRADWLVIHLLGSGFTREWHDVGGSNSQLMFYSDWMNCGLGLQMPYRYRYSFGIHHSIIHHPMPIFNIAIRQLHAWWRQGKIGRLSGIWKARKSPSQKKKILPNAKIPQSAHPKKALIRPVFFVGMAADVICGVKLIRFNIVYQLLLKYFGQSFHTILECNRALATSTQVLIED